MYGMKKNKMLVLTLLLSATLFLGEKSVNAYGNVDESEVFCRYLFGTYESSNALHGTWTGFWDKVSDVIESIGGLTDTDLGFYDKNKMGHGYLSNTLVDIIDNQGSIIVKQTESSSLYADFGDKINHGDFYENKEFFCQKEIYGKKPIQDKKTGRYVITLYSDKKSFHNEVIYIYNLFQGPTTRKAAAGTIEIRDISCLDILGGFYHDLYGILKIIRIVAPLLVIIYSTYDFVGAIFSKDVELLKKATERLRLRLILIAILFFLPIFLDIILGIIVDTSTTCEF